MRSRSMFMIILATIWVLLVMPTSTSTKPDPKEFEVRGVSFASIDDCNTAGNKWIGDLTNEAHSKGHKDVWTTLQWGKPNTAPEGATVTFSCVERDQ